MKSLYVAFTFGFRCFFSKFPFTGIENENGQSEYLTKQVLNVSRMLPWATIDIKVTHSSGPPDMSP